MDKVRWSVDLCQKGQDAIGKVDYTFFNILFLYNFKFILFFIYSIR